MRVGLLARLAFVLAAMGCATDGDGRPPADHYLRYVGFELPFNENVLLHWSPREMPLRVHLPSPPAGFYSDPRAVHDVVRDGVTDWSDVAGPGLPSFRFVASPGEADIQIAWAFEAPDPNWYVAHCIYAQTLMSKRFAVDRILVTARWRGDEPSLETLYATMLHEMGHALGLGGHSPVAADVMYRSVNASRPAGLSERDRATLRALYARPNGHRVTGPKRAE
jgi:predicted Zn-dependent protease